METKLFEVLDSGTCMIVLAVRLNFAPATEREVSLLKWSGYGDRFLATSPYIIMAKINGGPGTATYDPYGHPDGGRTLLTAHNWLYAKWDELSSGDVIDTEFIRGETDKPRTNI